MLHFLGIVDGIQEIGAAAAAQSGALRGDSELVNPGYPESITMMEVRFKHEKRSSPLANGRSLAQCRIVRLYCSMGKDVPDPVFPKPSG